MQDRRSELEQIFKNNYDRSSQTLNLYGQFLKDDDIEYLCDFLEAHPKITTVDISHNPLKHEGMEIFALRNTTVKRLIANDCLFADLGLEALASNAALTSLVVRNNVIGPNGIIKFAQRNESIVELDVTGNAIGEMGAKALVANEAVETVIKADLSDPQILEILNETSPVMKKRHAKATDVKRKFPTLVELTSSVVRQYSESDTRFRNDAQTKLTAEAKDEVKKNMPKHKGK